MELRTPDAMRLLAVTDRAVMGMGDLVGAARRALAAGLPALMLREKDLPDEELLPIAGELRAATNPSGALFIVNRRLKIARASGADGAHLGIDGPSLAEARRELGEEAILGYSAHDLNEALRAFDSGADYVVFSPIFETPSKQGVLAPVGLEALARLVETAPGPVLALGGVELSNVAQIAATGAAGMAAIRAIFASADPGRATADLLHRWDEARAGRTSPAQ